MTDKTPTNDIVISDEFKYARRLIENTGVNIFLTGRAGTGKTTFLKLLREHTAKNMVVLAPTGIAAINAGGQTIHSFFQLPLSPYVPGMTSEGTKRRYDRFAKEKLRLIRRVELIVIDEISMVRADLLDAMDASLRRHRNPALPFGGVQLLLIGDLAQLPPVVKPDEWELLAPHYDSAYFFSSHALQEAGYRMIELNQVYRQRDRQFLDILNRVRAGDVSQTTLDALNSRYIPDFNPDDADGYVRLTTHNDTARDINSQRMDALDGDEMTFDAVTTGDFGQGMMPADEHLTLKVGARVMFLRNDSMAGYFNGMLGTIAYISQNLITVIPDDDPDKTIDVLAVQWENMRYVLDEKTGQITEEVIGTFKQFPLRPAWAITIHKSQGLTFDRAIIDAQAAFAHGQTYVALSRCRTLEGMVLERPIPPWAIINDTSVTRYINTQRSTVLTARAVASLEDSYRLQLLDRLLGWNEIRRLFDALWRLVDEFLSRAYPVLADQYAQTDSLLADDLERHAQTFADIYHSGSQPMDDVIQRVKGACRYFRGKCEPLVRLLKSTPRQADNRRASKRLAETLDAIGDAMRIKMALLEHFADKDFTTDEYHAVSTRAMLDADKKTATKKSPKTVIPDEVLNPALYRRLVNWRYQLSQQLNKPAYTILSNRAIVAIANNMPLNHTELRRLPGLGDISVKAYGDQIIDIILNEE